jgi:hypothetical protein
MWDGAFLLATTINPTKDLPKIYLGGCAWELNSWMPHRA